MQIYNVYLTRVLNQYSTTKNSITENFIPAQGIKYFVVVVIVKTKITRSRDVGILASGQCCQDVINSDESLLLNA